MRLEKIFTLFLWYLLRNFKCCRFYTIWNSKWCHLFDHRRCAYLSLARQPSDPAAVDSPEAVQPQSQPQRTKTITFDVAGVTFNNESGRLRSRQTILKKISFCDPPFDSGYAARLERYLYNDEPAYYVYVNDYIVGNVPKGFIPYLEKNAGRPYIVEYFKVHGGGKKKYYGAEMRIKYTDIEGEE